MSVKHYRRDIDGLRAIAVAAVILFHAGVPGVGGGFVPFCCTSDVFDKGRFMTEPDADGRLAARVIPGGLLNNVGVLACRLVR